MTGYTIRPVSDNDARAIASIFNYYVTNSMAAYPSQVMDESFLPRIRSLCANLPFLTALSPHGEVVGFAMLRPLHIADTMRRSAEATIFIHPDYAKHGYGTELLKKLETEGKKLGVDTLIGGASSYNPASLEFQRKSGFVECGCFKRVGRKFDKDFDIIWMQKFI